jgi:hypothetical protein
VRAVTFRRDNSRTAKSCGVVTYIHGWTEITNKPLKPPGLVIVYGDPGACAMLVGVTVNTKSWFVLQLIA